MDLSQVFSLPDNLLVSGLMLEFEFTFSFAKVEFVTSDFFLELTVTYESKPCIVCLLNIIFLFTTSTTVKSFYEVSNYISGHSF